ncbi:SDR family oxidoreductase, partial [Nocardia cerradoensis]|uniref:SDR family oxidoreductase n=1 Tax=Nocardia cerradoensis TaxID=85688 RepID=UPI00117D0FE7
PPPPDSPPWPRTPIGRAPLLDDQAQRVPLGRLGQPTEIADAVVFLASPQARFITGIELFIDGGETQVWSKSRLPPGPAPNPTISPSYWSIGTVGLPVDLTSAVVSFR